MADPNAPFIPSGDDVADGFYAFDAIKDGLERNCWGLHQHQAQEWLLAHGWTEDAIEKALA